MFKLSTNDHCTLKFMALQCIQHSLSNLSLQVLLELARSRNKVPLPKSIRGAGISLPEEQDTLINPNYQLVVPKSQRGEETEDDEEPNPSQNPSHDQSYPPQDTPHRVSFQLGTKDPK